MRVSIQGEPGSFHDQAAHLYFHNQPISIVPKDTFTDTFTAIDQGQSDVAVVAVENTLYGSITETLDLLDSYQYFITGEIYLRIKQQLIGLQLIDLSKVTRVYSHPVALFQCQDFLDRHLPRAERIEYPDTAGSVRMIKEKNDPTAVAIAGKAAALFYKMPIVAKDIEDNQTNYTRFLILDPQKKTVTSADKVSLLLVTDHSPGALAYALSLFAQAGANLTKLQSRPIAGQSWRYQFYIDVEVTRSKLPKIIADIQQTGASIRVLGQYKAGATY